MFSRTYTIKRSYNPVFLHNLIEVLRAQLNFLGSSKKLTDRDVLKLSRRLDLLINLFMRLEADNIAVDNKKQIGQA
jgi:hypothetical protein